MPTNRRKREIRKLMAEKGLNYTVAMREHDRLMAAAKEAADQAAPSAG